MRRIHICSSIVLSLFLTQTAMANVSHYFSAIKNNPTALYQFFKNMPKGGELHYHLAGGATPEAMLALAPQGNFCMSKASYAIKPQDAHTPCQDTLLNQLDSKSTLYNKIIHSWSMKDFKPGLETAHDHFFASFFKFFPIVSSYGGELLATVMKRAARQHELYLEVMVLPDDAHSSTFGHLITKTPTLADKQTKLLSNPKMQDNIQHTITQSKELLTTANQQLGCDTTSQDPACALTVKLQYIILREQPINDFFAQALNGFAATSRSNDLVAINLVQAEDGSISLHDYRRQMKIIQFLHHTYPNVHITLHAGELVPEKLGVNTLTSNALRFHIHDALLLGHAERIGHGTDIQHEDDALKTLRYMSRASIPVEINLTSNQKLLHLKGKQHPTRFYLKHHVPVIFSTDDEGILRTNLSHEYVKAVIDQHLDYETLKNINRNTLIYNFLPGASLWADANKGVKVRACKNMHSNECLTWIKHSEKAKLQWELEHQLAIFEHKYHANAIL